MVSTLNFKLKEIKSDNYGQYAKFLSNSIGIYVSYEFRDLIPWIQVTKLKAGDEFVRLPGIYIIKEWYKEKEFKLQSFSLGEIISFREGNEYKSYFNEAKTIEEAIKIIAELIEKYAKDFVTGDEESFSEMETWFRAQVMAT